MPPPHQRPRDGCLLSRRWLGSGPLDVLRQCHKARGSSSLAQSGSPRSPQMALAAVEAYDYAFPCRLVLQLFFDFRANERVVLRLDRMQVLLGRRIVAYLIRPL